MKSTLILFELGFVRVTVNENPLFVPVPSDKEDVPPRISSGSSSLSIVPIACAVVFDVLLPFESFNSTVSFGSLV